jgi:hypothetical protein
MKQLSDPGLARTQRWMQAFILEPQGDDQEALCSPKVQAELPADEALRIVLPSETLTATERVGIYRGMYLARLGEALESDYPGLLHYLGEDDFYALVAKYLDAYPSRSYTLNRLGDHLPEFIAKQPDLAKRDFLFDLARLELALTQVFDAPESPVLKQEEISAVPPDSWDRVVLKPIEALRLISFQYPVSEYLGGVDQENPFPVIRRRQTYTVAYRRDFFLHRSNLKRPTFEMLSALASGMSVGAAIEQYRPSQKRLFEWFRDWTSEGFFQSLSY